MATIDLAHVGKNLVKSADTGESVELRSLWQDQPVVLFFLRRFGCQICRWMASEISKLEPDLQASGVALVGIGPEDVGLKEFMEGGFFKGSIYVDEPKKCYKDLGFKRYTALSVVPAALGKKVRDVAAKVEKKSYCTSSKTHLEIMYLWKTFPKLWGYQPKSSQDRSQWLGLTCSPCSSLQN
ncbi:prostamide/prostaglandin F synthase isoform X5 [Channa argus]|uniref:prostamide/prostaglandin F synthase isoform X5 n=1 Tax=Channa argus TaxID=215402 RepID=UPI0035225051